MNRVESAEYMQRIVFDSGTSKKPKRRGDELISGAKPLWAPAPPADFSLLLPVTHGILLSEQQQLQDTTQANTHEQEETDCRQQLQPHC